MIRIVAVCIFLCVGIVAAAPVDCATFKGLPNSQATNHFRMGETITYEVPGNTVEKVYQCKLPFAFDADEGFTLYVLEQAAPGTSTDSDPGPSDFSDILVGEENLLTLYSDPSEFIDNYRTIFTQQPSADNTVTEIGDERNNHFVWTQKLKLNLIPPETVDFADYYIDSDITPEPIASVLVGSGLAGLILLVRRHHTAVRD